MIKTSALTLALTCTLSLAGCSPHLAPLYNARSEVMAPVGGPVTLEEIEQAIIRGAAAKQWNIRQDAPGSFIATITSGGHTAVVRIDYDIAGWTIERVETSPGLKFDGTVIHRRYNGWVNNLDGAIKAQITNPPTAAAAAATPAPAETVSPPAEAPPAPAEAPPAEATPAAATTAPAAAPPQ